MRIARGMRVAVELAQQLLVHPYVVAAADRPTEVEPHATAAITGN